MIQTVFGFPVVVLKDNNIEKLFPKETYNQVFDYLTDPANEFIGHSGARGGKICTTSLHHVADIWRDTLDNLPELLDFLKTTASNYAHLYSTNPIIDLKFQSSWVNLTFYGCEISSHYDKLINYKKSIIVLFYPSVPPNSSDLCFIHNSKGGEWPSDCLESDLIRIKINQGDIVIIDDSIYHAVDVQQASDPRMCIAIEFELITN